MIKSLAPFVGKKVFIQLKSNSQFLAALCKDGVPIPYMEQERVGNGVQVRLKPLPFIGAEIVEHKGVEMLLIRDELGNSGLKMLVLPDLDSFEFVTAISDDPPEQIERKEPGRILLAGG